MEILQTISDIQRVRKGCILTIGNFDGVHIGHQEILATAKKAAKQRGPEFVVMTFEPHPLTVLYNDKQQHILTPLALKKHLLAECGVDYLFIVKSNRELLSLSPEDFVKRFIVKNFQPLAVLEGESFNFGSARAGNSHTLQELGAKIGFEVSVIETRQIKLSTGRSVAVSSTLIRGLLASGCVDDADIALGRPYRLIGQIIPGRGRGRYLGFPTANMQRPNQLIPKEGVYAGFVGIADSEEKVCAAKEKVPAAFSISIQDSVETQPCLLIEAHLLRENIGKLYGKWLAMDFVKRIRDQQKFQTDAELSAQIAKDCIVAGEILY